MTEHLVNLPAVERLSPRVIRILGGNPSKFTLQGTNTYLIGTGPSRILIDTGHGLPAWLISLKRVLDEEKCSVSQALITHWHHDHASGIPDLLSVCPDATVHKYIAPSMAASATAKVTAEASNEASSSPDKDMDNDDLAAQPYFARDTTHKMPYHPITTSPPTRFSAPGATLTPLHTPGHTRDHISFLLAEESALFTGDTVLGQGTAVFEDLATYTASLALMAGAFAGRAYPGHGPVVEDGPARCREYISHRKQREAQVWDVLSGGDGGADGGGHATGEERGWWTAGEIVRVVYAAYPRELWGPAEGGVVKILEKLAGEGRVVTGERGRWRTGAKAAL